MSTEFASPALQRLSKSLVVNDLHNYSWLNNVSFKYNNSVCGSCWAFAAAGSLSDRVRIAAKGSPIELNLSPQTLLDCHLDAGSCMGGNSLAAYESVVNLGTGFTDDTCLPYEGVDYSNWGESNCSDRMCKTNDRFGVSSWVNGTKIYVDGFGAVDASDLTAVMSEVDFDRVSVAMRKP